MESYTSIVNDNILNENNKNDILSDNLITKNEQIQNFSFQNEENNDKGFTSSVLTNDKESINSSSHISLLSENELKEIENAYRITDSHQFGKIRRIDPTRFLHSLPDGAYPQLPRLRKYTTVYTSNILFPLNETNIDNSSITDLNKNNDKNNILKDNNINNSKEYSLLHIYNSQSNRNESCKQLVNDLKRVNKNTKEINTKTKNNELEDISDDTKIDINNTYKNLMPKFTDMVKVKKINFPMIMDVLNGKRTSTLYERQSAVIEKLIKIIKESMKDEYIPWLIDIINSLRQKILNGGDILVKPLIDLIDSIKIYEFIYNSNNPLENKKIKLLNTILKTITIPNYPKLCYCILKTISNFSAVDKNERHIPPIDPPVLCKPLSEESLNIYFNLYCFKQSTKSFYVIGKSKVIKYLLNSPYIYTHSEVQLSCLMTLKTLLQSDELCDNFLNYDGMNLLCKYTNSMTNVKFEYNNSIINDGNINDVTYYEPPVAPHQSIGDLNNTDIEFNNHTNVENANSDYHLLQNQVSINNYDDDTTDNESKFSVTTNDLKINDINRLKNIKLDFDSIYIIIEIFLYIINVKKRDDAVIQIVHKESLFYLKNIYEQICVCLKREVHKNIRNDFVTLFSRMLEITITSSKKLSKIFYKVDLTKLIYNELLKNNTIFMNKIIQIEYEYKQILLGILIYLCYLKENIILLLDMGFLEYSFKYLTFENNENTKYLNVIQLKEIQLQILEILYLMLQEKAIAKEWYKLNGCQILYNYLPDAIFNESGLYDGCNIISSTVGLVSSTLKVILYSSHIGIYMKTHLGNLGIFKIILEILNSNSYDYDIIQLGLMICSSLCYDCMQNKDIFNKEGGVGMLIQKLKYQNPNKANQKIILLSTIDCIWKSICGCKKSEFRFFEKEGLKLLINLIDSNKEVRNHAMGCLLDLMENINARSYILLWRSNNNCNIGIEQLLINIWMEIENNIGVNKINGNIISNTHNPLHSDQFIKDNNRIKENIELNKSCTINEIKDDCRAKIFSIFSILGFDTFDSTLTIDQKIYLEYIKRYLDFKIGEIWDEIIDELNIQGIRPVTPDNDYVMAIRRSLIKKGENVQKFQQELSKMKNKLQKTEDMYFMEELQQIERIKYESLEREKYQNRIKKAFKSQN